MIKLQDIIMVLIDKRILAGGIALLVVGFALTISISSTMPIGQAGMTEVQEKIERYWCYDSELLWAAAMNRHRRI